MQERLSELEVPIEATLEQIRAVLPAELITDFESELNINPPWTSMEAPESDPRYQRAYAKCCSFMQSVFADRDISLKQLEALVINFGTTYHFAEEDLHKAQSLIGRYDQLRNDIDRLRKEFNNDTDLVKRLTEVDVPAGTKLDIEVGAVSINITTDEETAGLLFTDGKERLKLLTDCRIGGYMFKTNDTVPINYTVLVEGRSQQTIKKHEEQHIVNKRLFIPEFEPREKEDLELQQERAWKRAEETQDESEKIELYRGIMLVERETALRLMKDELIAVVRAGYLPATKARIVGQEGDAYDWLEPLRKHEADELWPGLSQRILVEEYRETIEHSFEAADQIKALPNFSIDDVTALLNTNPLSEWPDIAMRQQETFKEVEKS